VRFISTTFQSHFVFFCNKHGASNSSGIELASGDMNVHHFVPHIARARFAEIQFALDRSFQRLDVVENQWESQQASTNRHCAEHNGGECHHTT
jgi:hypothetical protein